MPSPQHDAQRLRNAAGSGDARPRRAVKETNFDRGTLRAARMRPARARTIGVASRCRESGGLERRTAAAAPSYGFSPDLGRFGDEPDGPFFSSRAAFADSSANTRRALARPERLDASISATRRASGTRRAFAIRSSAAQNCGSRARLVRCPAKVTERLWSGARGAPTAAAAAMLDTARACSARADIPQLGPSIFSGRTHFLNCSSLSSPSVLPASSSVVPSRWARLAIFAALS